MTKDDSNTQDRFAGLSRLQLQTLCVKAGLDSTADVITDNTSVDSDDDAKSDLNTDTVAKSDTTTGNTPPEEHAGDMAMEDVHQGSTSSTDDVSGDTHIKLETADDAAASPSPAKSVEGNSTKTVETIGQEEGGEKTMKVETDAETPLADVKSEETPTPIAQRKEFWESKSTPRRSALPVRVATASVQRNASTLGTPSQKRARASEDTDGSNVIKEDDDKDENNSTSLPTPGTVRSLIGKFAGSTINPSETPQIKKRKVETSRSSPAVPIAPTIPKYKKVIKIPAAKTTTNKSSVVGARKGAAFDSSSSGSKSQLSSSGGLTVKKRTISKPISAETINRLATPKKVNTASASSSSAAAAAAAAAAAGATAPPSSNPPATPTRPRGPVLSTASRAAQRRNREKK
ncbi:hypothetical protein BGZ65_002979 [Modicella reniformis]|uniref:Uncharacterized protein n=1 Tax=Modicella reniformis TaxID=1440133 RepID=A0A9P6SVG1_9FUNG|nr:hypothetical protein BGZ65_002979 [Modicella reniformis]